MQQEELTRVVAENLAKYRKAANLTQSELAEKLNYSDKSVSKWEQGNGMPDVLVLYKLAQLYGVTVNDFLVLHEEERPKMQKKKNTVNRGLILVLSVGLVWLVAVVAFVFLRLILPDMSYAWMAFIFALPVSCIVGVVLCCVWKFYILRSVTASALIWTSIAGVYLLLRLLLPEAKNLAMLFFIGIPLQALAVIWFVFRQRVHKKK